jgi:hypothetical protein
MAAHDLDVVREGHRCRGLPAKRKQRERNRAPVRSARRHWYFRTVRSPAASARCRSAQAAYYGRGRSSKAPTYAVSLSLTCRQNLWLAHVGAHRVPDGPRQAGDPAGGRFAARHLTSELGCTLSREASTPGWSPCHVWQLASRRGSVRSLSFSCGSAANG